MPLKLTFADRQKPSVPIFLFKSSTAIFLSNFAQTLYSLKPPQVNHKSFLVSTFPLLTSFTGSIPLEVSITIADLAWTMLPMVMK